MCFLVSLFNCTASNFMHVVSCCTYFVLTGLPICPELTREHIPKTRDVGHFLSVTGTVIRTSLVKVLEFERSYICNKCKHVFVAKADFEQYYAFCRPSACLNEEGCNSTKFTCLSGTSSSPTSCRDYQEIKIQEQVKKKLEKGGGYHGVDVSNIKIMNFSRKVFGGLISCWDKTSPLILAKLYF